MFNRFPLETSITLPCTLQMQFTLLTLLHSRTGLALAVRCCEFSCLLTRQPLHSNNQNVQSTFPVSRYGASMLTNSISCIVECFQNALSLLHTCMNATWSQEHFSENCSELLFYIRLISDIHSFTKLSRQLCSYSRTSQHVWFSGRFPSSATSNYTKCSISVICLPGLIK